jgi:hypothetical protein
MYVLYYLYRKERERERERVVQINTTLRERRGSEREILLTRITDP